MSKRAKSVKVPRTYFDGARDYDKVVDAELKFYRGLIAMGVKTDCPGNTSVAVSIKKMMDFTRDPKGRSIEFTVEFDVEDPRGGSTHKLFIGTELRPGSENSLPKATHYLCLADEQSLQAKFHADFDFDSGAKEKKPSPHVQIGGGIPGDLAERYPGKRYWHPDLDKPRMPALPVCTALLWHWAFLEYENNQTFTRIRRKAHWNNLIKDAEDAVLKPFFSDGERLFRMQPAKGLLNALYVPLTW